MNELFAVLAQSKEINLILVIGVAIFFGTVGAKVFRRFHVPQIIGYIAIGVTLGPLLKMISSETLTSLEPFNILALGIIGFLIGGELKKDIFARFGKQVFSILLFEGVTAFLLVGTLSFFVMLFFSVGWQISLAAALVFGAICSATDPASTVNVLWEYKTRGPLTTMLTTIVALDDGLALVLYIGSVSIAGALTGHKVDGGLLRLAFHATYEIIGSLGLGVIGGLVLGWIVKRVKDDETMLVFTTGSIILTIGVAASVEMDVILSSMALGVTLINMIPGRGLKSIELVRKFSPPIYVLFFVIIGSRLNISNISSQIWLLTAAYIVGSIVGKTTGSYLGASYSKAGKTIKNYLGFCLYQQGTIAIALLIMASSRFEGVVKDTMISVIIIGVFVLQLIGPVLVKVGARKAGEVGLNITEDDLIASFRVRDVMKEKVPVIAAGASLSDVLKVMSSTDSFYYSVVDSDNRLIGAVTLDGVRNTFMTQELNDWLVALDIAEPVTGKVTPEMPLSDALEKTTKLNVEYVPVTVSSKDNRFAGILDVRSVHRSLSAEVLERQRKADSMYGMRCP